MAKPILFVDAYQTCIETGKDALEKSLEEAFTTLSQREIIPAKVSFSIFSKQCTLVCKYVLKKYIT